MTIETVNKFTVITGRKSPLTRYHHACITICISDPNYRSWCLTNSLLLGWAFEGSCCRVFFFSVAAGAEV